MDIRWTTEKEDFEACLGQEHSCFLYPKSKVKHVYHGQKITKAHKNGK